MGSLCPSATNNTWGDTSPQTIAPIDFQGLSGMQVYLPKNKNPFSQIYDIETRKLGFGHYGDVKKCMHKETGVVRAVKIFNKERLGSNSLNENWFFKQIDVLSKISHPCFIKVHEFFEDRDYFHLIMDYHKGGDLLHKLKAFRKLNEAYVLKIIRQLLIGVSYLHNLHIVHRDLKPENVLIDEDNENASIKIIDFDTAVPLPRNGMLTGLSGTLYYMAPETLDSPYNEKCDIWSIGIIMYTLLSGSLPYVGMSDHYILSNIQKIPIDVNSVELFAVSDKAKNLLRRLISKDPKKRPSAEEALAHHCFSQDPGDPMSALVILESIELSKIKSTTVKDFLISNFCLLKDYSDLDKAFIELDTDRDGVISILDFEQFYMKMFSAPEAKAKTDKMLKVFRGFTEEFITYSDFLNATINVKKMLDEKRIAKFLNSRENAKRHKSCEESSSGDFNESLKTDDELDDWIVEVKSKLDQDMTPRDFQEVMLDKIYIKA